MYILFFPKGQAFDAFVFVVKAFKFQQAADFYRLFLKSVDSFEGKNARKNLFYDFVWNAQKKSYG